MSKKTIILTQKQLDEIVGGNTTYLDNEESEFVQDGANNVYTGEKTDREDSDPVTSDKFAKQIRRDSSFYGLNRNIKTVNPVMIACSKEDWKKKNLIKEDNQDLVGTNFGVGQSVKDNMSATGDSAGANAVENGGISYGNAKTIKSRMNDLQQAAKKGDVKAQQTYQNMGGEVLQDFVTNKLNNATALDKRDKENRSEMGFNNVYQKPGGTKVGGNGKAHTDKQGNTQVITYESKINEARSIKSQKLLNILNAHGGVYSDFHMHKPFPMTNSDIHNLTDDCVLGVVDYDDINSTIKNIMTNKLYGFKPGDDIDAVHLMDGKYVLLLSKDAHQVPSRKNEPTITKDYFQKKRNRDKSASIPDGKNYYKWKSEDAHNLKFNNPYYKNWSDESKKQLNDKIKQDYNKK